MGTNTSGLGSNREIAENKLILLYILDKLQIPAGSGHIMNIVLDNYFMNYFMFRQYLNELCAEGLAEAKEVGGEGEKKKSLYTITPAGSQTLGYLHNLVPAGIRATINNLLKDAKKAVRDEARITAEYSIGDINEYNVTCAVKEEDFMIVELKATVSDQSEAIKICDNWKKYSHLIYPEIMQSLFAQRDSCIQNNHHSV